MRPLLRYALTIATLLVSSPSFALEMEFYTYDGFTEIVNAFKRLALVFGNNDYVALFAVAAVLGIFLGALFWAARAVVGGGGNTLLYYFLSVLAGVAIFQGMVLPKGSLHIYDPVRNAYEQVGGIPDIIVLVAGFTNKFERAMQRITDAGSAHPYAKEAGGLSFNLMFNATGSPLFANNYYLKKTLETYYLQCSGPALARAGSGLTYDTLRSSTTDLLAEFEKMKHSMFFTQVYNDTTRKSGESVTCTEAFDNHIKPALIDPAVFADFTKLTCLKTGFNVADILQWSTCQTRLNESYVNLFDGTGGQAVFIRNLHLAEAVTQSMLNINPEVGLRTLTNRNMMTQGIGAAVAANDWVPKVRASVMTLVLGIMPLLMLFILSPLYAKALQLLVVLILWVTVWGVIDIVASQIIIDQAYSAAAEIKEHGQGLVAFMTAPESATQGLAVIGKARGMAAVIASVICAILFKMSASGFSSMASNWGGMASNEGSINADKALNPENHTDSLRSLRQAKSDGMIGSKYGENYMDSMAVFNGAQQAAEANSAISNLSSMTGGHNPSMAGELNGTRIGAGTSGTTKGMLSLSPGEDLVSRIGSISGEMNEYSAKQDVGKWEGNNAVDLKSKMAPEQRAAANQYTQGMEEIANTRLTENLAGTRQSANPGMTEGDAYYGAAQQNRASEIGAAQASGFNVDRILDTKWIESRQEIAGAEAYEKVRQQGLGFGDPFSDAQIAEGRQLGSISNAIGTGIGVNEAGMGRVIDAGAVSQIESAAHGKAVREAASADGQSTVARADEMAAISQSGASASRDALNLLAEKMGGTVEDLQLAKELATGNNVMVSAEKLRDMNERGVISLSEQQLAAIEEHGGGHAYLQFTPDGEFVGVNVSAGNVVSSSDNLSKDTSVSHRVAPSFAGGDAYALLAPEKRGELREIMSQMDDEYKGIGTPKPTMEAYFDNLTSTVHSYLNTDILKQDATSFGVDGGAGLSAGKGAGNKVEAGGESGGGSPVSASIGLSGSYSGSKYERDTYGLTKHTLIENWRDASRWADKQMFKDGYMDKASDEYSERHNELATDYFAMFASKTVNDARRMGANEAVGTDFYEQQDRPDASVKKSGQMGRGKRYD